MPSPSESKVYFFFPGVSFTLRNRRSLKKYIEHIFKREKRKLRSLNYIFCSDKKVLDINRQYMNHDYYTDIITFELSENENETMAEIYISIERVRDNAAKLGTSFSAELHRVIFHGVLHLCGYNDKIRNEITSMRKKEDFYLKKYFKVSRDTVSR